ncbi:MAG: hypothetical protein H0V35_02710 [Nitrospira sp.]|nr:hypothetical protein [Nitrospira sp.]
MPNHSGRILLVAGFFCLAAFHKDDMAAVADETPPPAQPALADRLPPFQEVVNASAAQLSALPAEGDSLTIFKKEIGPRLGLKDAAMTVGAKGFSPALTKELLLADLTRSAVELVRGLAAWQLSQSIRDLATSPTAERSEVVQRQLNAQMAWFIEGTTLEPSLLRLVAIFGELPPRGTVRDMATEPIRCGDAAAHMIGAAAEVESWAIQTVHREWFRLLNWKDQVRQQRGLVRLCGTWQWSIHNHQNHREEKTAVMFAPPGALSPTGPAEIIILGDSVFLRWETRAGMQEDSLLFSGEGQRLEGTFVNTAGGWGSITGKRTASCANGAGEKRDTGKRRRQ